MKRNYIEINLTKYALDYDHDIAGDRESVIKDLEAEGGKSTIPYHERSMMEIKNLLLQIYTGAEVVVEERDPTTIWIWPNGYMEQWSD